MSTADPVLSNPEQARAYYRKLDNQGPVASREFLGDGYIDHRANHTGAPVDRSDALAKAYVQAFPDLTHIIIDQVCEGDVVVERIRYFATHLGTFMGLPATGRQVTFTGMDWVRFDNGKIVERWTVADEADLRRQLLGLADPYQTATNKILAREYYEANDRFGIATGAAYGPGSAYYGPNHTGFEDTDLASRGRKYYEAFPDFFHVVMDQIAEGDIVVERIRYYATHRAMFMGIPATHKKITYTGMDWVRMKEGRVVDRYGMADALSIRRQLLGEPDPTPGKTWYADFPKDFEGSASALADDEAAKVKAKSAAALPKIDDPGNRQRHTYFEDTVTDRLVDVCLELASALWVTRDRLKVVEGLLAEQSLVTPQMIEDFQLPSVTDEDRDARDAFIGRIFGPLKII